jgi:hypothetical protein
MSMTPSGQAGHRAEDLRTLFTHGSKHDSDSFYAAMREAQERPSRSALFTSGGREFVLLQSFDDDSWHYRPPAAERERQRTERASRKRAGRS